MIFAEKKILTQPVSYNKKGISLHKFTQLSSLCPLLSLSFKEEEGVATLDSLSCANPEKLSQGKEFEE